MKRFFGTKKANFVRCINDKKNYSIPAMHNANKSHQNEAGRSHRLVAVYLMKLQEYRCEKFILNIF